MKRSDLENAGYAAIKFISGNLFLEDNDYRDDDITHR